MCFGGPSQAEKDLQKEQAAFTATLDANYKQTFAEQQQIYQTLNAVLQPIVNAGPNQQGFSAAELSILNTQAIESNAQGYDQAMRAAAARENSAGGGTTFLPSGVNAQINAEIGSAAERNLSREELGITSANYATGRQNWETALAGEQGIATGQNPLGYAGATTNSNTQAFNEAKVIHDQSSSLFGDILGGITGIAGAIPGIGTAVKAGKSSIGVGGGPPQSSQTSDWWSGGDPIS